MVARQRRTYHHNNDHCPPGWVWLLAGVLIGVFLSFLFYLYEVAPHTLQAQKSPPPAVTENTTNTTKKPAASVAETTQKMPRFEFYDMLPNTEAKFPKATLPKAEPPRTEPVKVPKVTPNLNTATPNNTTASEDMSGPHILQIGSFREESEAEGLKAHLALLGIQASIQRLAITGTDEVWYRVRVGPFTDINQLNQMRAQLFANNISAIVLRF